VQDILILRFDHRFEAVYKFGLADPGVSLEGVATFSIEVACAKTGGGALITAEAGAVFVVVAPVTCSNAAVRILNPAAPVASRRACDVPAGT
jgi:hypothetical protein